MIYNTDNNNMTNGTKMDGSGQGSKRPSMVRRASSMIRSARLSFIRSQGERGANVETLRGTTGADFEATARVIRTNTLGSLCFCFRGSSDSKSEKKQRFVLIKGTACFVFESESAPAPTYAIPLARLKAEGQESNGNRTTVNLLSTLGDLEYEFIFDTKDNKNISQNFIDAVNLAASIGEENAIRKELGHGDLVMKRNSVQYAETVAGMKAKQQPEVQDNVGNLPGEAYPMGVPPL